MRHRLDLPSVWRRGELDARTLVHRLTPAEIAAFDATVTAVEPHLGGDPQSLLQLPVTALTDCGVREIAEGLRVELREGRGAVMLRGLPVGRWSRMQCVIAYWALGEALGRPVPSTAEGDLLGHVVDVGADYGDPRVRGYQTRAELVHHCDNCSLVALLCLNTARHGGESMIASAPAIWNTFVARRPDLLDTLQESLCWSRMGEVAAGQSPWYEVPLVEFVDGRFHCAAAPDHIRKGHALPGAPGMTPAQDEALRLFESYATELELRLWLQPGDVQILNNALVVHRRSRYEDWPEPARRRHLLRLWLDEPSFHRGSRFFDGSRDGILAGAAHPRLRLNP